MTTTRAVNYFITASSGILLFWNKFCSIKELHLNRKGPNEAEAPPRIRMKEKRFCSPHALLVDWGYKYE